MPRRIAEAVTVDSCRQSRGQFLIADVAQPLGDIRRTTPRSRIQGHRPGELVSTLATQSV